MPEPSRTPSVRELAPARGARARGRPAPPPARRRARAAAERLGPLRADRGALRPDARRLLLPLLVPGEVEGIENVPVDRRRAARLEPLRRAAARRGDDRQGDQARSTRTRGRSTSRSSTSSRAIPGFSMLIPKIGCVAAHPANVQRLLYDEEQLVLVFPEGRKGTEKLYKDRYRLRRFGRGGFVEAAMRARAPIVPVCVVGRRGGGAGVRAGRRCCSGSPACSTSRSRPRSRTSGRSGCSATCRPSSRSASSSRCSFDEQGLRRGQGARADGRPRGPRADPGEPVRHDRQAQVGVVRMSGLEAHPRHRRVDLLGRPARAGARGASRRSRRSSASTPRSRTVELERDRVREGRRPARAAAADRRGRRDRHGGRHAARGRLVDDHDREGAREQRDRDDEHPRRLQRAGLDRPQVRLQVLDPLLRLRAGRPGVLHETMRRPHPPRTPIERDIVEAEASLDEFAEKQPDRRRSRSCASPTCSARTCGPRTSTCSRCPSCR